VARPAAYGWRRIAVTVLVVLAMMTLGLIAGRWQWGRYETRDHSVKAHDSAVGLPTVPLDSVLTLDDDGPGDAAWRTVTVAGVIDAADLVELRGRSVDSTASIQYLAWLHTERGETVLINLGWTSRSEPTTPEIPGGPVTVTGTVRAFESDNGKPGTRVTPTQMGGIDGEVVQAYVMADSACGDDGCVTGLEPVPLPDLSLGPHLSYAMQWWLLMAAAAPVAVWLTVRDARLERERASESASPSATGKPAARPARAATPAKRRRPSDEEIEDAL